MPINPRFAAYAQAHNHSVCDQINDDETNWPGGVMCGFILWISEMKAEFAREYPSLITDTGLIQDQSAFTTFLDRRAIELQNRQ